MEMECIVGEKYKHFIEGVLKKKDFHFVEPL